MKLARVRLDGRELWAKVDGEHVLELLGDRFGDCKPGRPLAKLAEVKLLAPIEPHNKILALLGNFVPRGDRPGPGFFVKPPSAVVDPDEPIVRPSLAPAFNFEAELAVVIGRRARNVSRGAALEHVLGYTIGNDVTSFPLKEIDGPLSTRWKTLDTFYPLGPWIVTGLDPSRLQLRARLNGERKQDTPLSAMTFGVAETIEWVSRGITLEPGDVISMATPPGFCEMVNGDVVECEISEIGVLRNPVVARS